MSKYRNKKTVVDGITFDSMKESRRYSELVLLKSLGHIEHLELQPSFDLIPKIKWNGKTLRKRVYKADFKYWDVETGSWTVEDVKGFRTDMYKIKLQLFLHRYPEYRFIET